MSSVILGSPVTCRQRLWVWSPCGFWVGWQEGLGKTSLLEMLGEGFPLPGGGWGHCGAGGCSSGMENPLCAYVCVHAHTYMLRVCLFLVSLGLSRTVTLPLSLSLSLSKSLPVDPGLSVSLSSRCLPSPLSSFPLYSWMPGPLKAGIWVTTANFKQLQHLLRLMRKNIANKWPFSVSAFSRGKVYKIIISLLQQLVWPG